MKNRFFGRENDTPIQKKYGKSISDDIDIDLGDDISLYKDNINKKKKKKKKINQVLTKKKNKKKN